MVGVLSMLFFEMFVSGEPKAPSLQRETAQQATIGYGDMRLGEDMIYRPVSFMDHPGQNKKPSGSETPTPVSSQTVPDSASSQIEHTPNEALLRWELSLDHSLEGHSNRQENMAIPAVRQTQ